MKKYNNSLVKRLIFASFNLLIFASLTSCVDTVLLPDDKTVDEDFWKTKGEVSSMVYGAYKDMLSADIMNRLIVWGDFRSDEFLMSDGLNGAVPDDLEEIEGGAIETDNTFNAWGAFYTVINDCNIVLKKAEGVMTLDPDYQPGDYQADRSQMLALRSLCYFYLVRAFRDVPYITEAYMNSSQEMNIPKICPDTVMLGCINDLEEAEKYAVQPDGYGDWRGQGLFTKLGIQALLADMYLWMASVKDQSNPELAATYYQKCVDYCDQIIDYKRNHVVLGPGETLDKNDLYHLYPYNQYFNKIYFNDIGNEHEGIFELFFPGAGGNSAVNQMYRAGTGQSYLVIPECYGVSSGTYASYAEGNYESNVYGNYDTRLFNNVYEANSTTLDFYYTRKYVEIMDNGTLTAKKRNVTDGGGGSPTWIIYRLADVMLMKAEALVQLTGNNNEDVRARQAFNIVQAVNLRALYLDNRNDSLTWAKCEKLDLEKLVLAERARELAFEGKRWFDMLRYNYRNVAVATDYSKTLNEMEDAKIPFAEHNDFFKSLLVRKYEGGAGAGVLAKMPTEPYLYMPMNQNDIEVNPLLLQNPVYSANKQWKKDV